MQIYFPTSLLRLLFIASLLLTSNLLWAQGTIIRGTVRNVDGDPLVGATIFAPELKIGAYANEEGIFSLPIKMDRPPGGIGTIPVDLIITYFGYDTAFEAVEVRYNRVLTLGVILNERIVLSDEVEILGRRTGEIDKTQVDIGVTEISAQEINLIPSLGAPDLAQVLQVQPGVVFTGDQGGQLYIRGGTPIQNMVLMDNMIIYSPFHSIGLFSVFDTDYIRSVEVHSAAFPGQYGGRISSVIDIKTRNGSFDTFKGKVNINPFSSNVLAEGPLIKGKKPGSGLSYMVSARNNYIDRTSPTLYPYVNDSTSLPYNFLDLYGKLTVSDGVNQANVFGFRQTDNVNFEFPANIGWDAVGGGANFQLLPSEAGAIISGTFAYSSYTTGLSSQSENFPRSSQIQGFNGTLQVGYIFNAVDEFKFGLSFLGFSTDYEFTNSFGFRTAQQASNTEAAIYATYKKVIQTKDAAGRAFERAVIEPSVHVHYYNNQRAATFEPRLRAKLNTDRVSLSVGTGMYSQNLMAAVSDRDVVNLFQGFLSAPEELAYNVRPTTLQYAWHGLVGVEMALFENVTTNVEGWYKNFTQLTSINRDKIFEEDPDFITETGEAMGLDFIVKYQSKNLYAYANYGLAKVTRTDRLNTEEPRTYPPVFDRRHTANFIAAWKKGRFDARSDANRPIKPKFSESKWEFGVRWSLGSGFPFTQTQGYFEKLDFQDDGAQTDISTQNGQLGLILADQLNGGRLPYYHRMDLSAKRRWLFDNRILLEVNASAINVYNRRNIFYFDRVRFATVYQFPFVPSLGITAKY